MEYININMEYINITTVIILELPERLTYLYIINIFIILFLYYLKVYLKFVSTYIYFEKRDKREK